MRWLGRKVDICGLACALPSGLTIKEDRRAWSRTAGRREELLLSMNPNLETVVELQQAIIQLREAEQRLHGIPDWMRELHEEHAVRKAEVDEIEQTVEDAARERRAGGGGGAGAADG